MNKISLTSVYAQKFNVTRGYGNPSNVRTHAFLAANTLRFLSPTISLATETHMSTMTIEKGNAPIIIA
ncbi:MAG: hypothetical protein OEX82_04070, partial [Nitrosomonas sp.]|nr:hypothetical protein [Nitrosomonas sp.]